MTGQRLQYSVGFGLSVDAVAKLDTDPAVGVDPGVRRRPAPRDGAWVTELTGLLDLTGWPDGMRVIVRAERPHPGAQLRFTDSNGNRLTAFATNTKAGNSRTWNCGTGAAPAARTASATQRTPG